MCINRKYYFTHKHKTKQNPDWSVFGTLHAIFFAKPKTNIKQDSIKLIATEIRRGKHFWITIEKEKPKYENDR